MPDTIAVMVAHKRPVLTTDGTQGPGSSFDMAADEAALLAVWGFVTLMDQETAEPRTTRVEDEVPDRIGLQAGAQRPGRRIWPPPGGGGGVRQTIARRPQAPMLATGTTPVPSLYGPHARAQDAPHDAAGPDGHGHVRVNVNNLGQGQCAEIAPSAAWYRRCSASGTASAPPRCCQARLPMSGPSWRSQLCRPERARRPGCPEPARLPAGTRGDAGQSDAGQRGAGSRDRGL